MVVSREREPRDPYLSGESRGRTRRCNPDLFLNGKGNPFSKIVATVLRQAQDGKAAEREGKSENLIWISFTERSSRKRL